MKTRIIRSRARCTLCNDVMESKHRHDFVSCWCGMCFLDGGTDYVRCGYGEPSDIELLTDYQAPPKWPWSLFLERGPDLGYKEYSDELC